MIRITVALTGALAALAFSAATAHAHTDYDYPTPIGDGFNYTDCCVTGPWGALETQYFQDFSVPNDPADTFEGLVREDSPFFGYSGIASDNNVYVEQDITGNVPIGEQYNSLNFGGPTSPSLDGFHLIYNDIGGTPEAFLSTPFGDLNFPTWFVEAVGPSLFEPSFYTEPPPSGATMAAAELPAQAFSAATAQADYINVYDPDGPTPFGDSWGTTESSVPYVVLQYEQYTDYSVPNDPSETFVGLWRGDIGYLNGLSDDNVSVVQDISGNVPVGEQYNDFHIGDFWSVVYNDIGVTPEAFYITPLGDLNVPTWFVEAVGPTFFEPSAPWLEGLTAATLPAAELPGLAADVTSLLPGVL